MQQLRSFSQAGEMQGTGPNNGQSLDAPDTFVPHTPYPPVADLAHSLHGESSAAASRQQFAALPDTPPVSATPSSEVPATDTPQNVPGTIRSARPVVVIRADKQRKRTAQVADASGNGKHLRPRARLIVLLAALLVILGGTLVTLAPLSSGQSSVPVLSGLSMLIHNPQSILQLQAQQTPTAAAAFQAHATTLNISHSQYVAIAQQDATNVGISPTYFVRQIQQESGFNPNAVSPSGAVGIAQFMPSTAAGLGIDPWNPLQALKGAAQMMANLYHQYGDYAKALAAYNAGSANLNNAISSCGSKWLSCMPGQTQNYIATIMG